MAVRTPDLDCPSLEALLQEKSITSLRWHSIQCQLLTPLYGGGVESATVDQRMPIRVSAIRGQLRIWWRLLAKHKWKLGDDVAIRKAEFALWGGMGKEAHASEVFLKVSDVQLSEVVSYQDYATKPKQTLLKNGDLHQSLATLTNKKPTVISPWVLLTING